MYNQDTCSARLSFITPVQSSSEQEGHLPSTVGSQNRLVAREMRGGIERAYGYIRFRAAGNSGPEAGSDHVNVHNRGVESFRSFRFFELPT